MLAGALGALEATGQPSRCIHPAAKLAELRSSRDGSRRRSSSRRLRGSPEALARIAHLQLLKGEQAVAASLLLRRLNDR